MTSRAAAGKASTFKAAARCGIDLQAARPVPEGRGLDLQGRPPAPEG